MPATPYVISLKEQSWKALLKNTPYIREMYKGVKIKGKGEMSRYQVGSK